MLYNVYEAEAGDCIMCEVKTHGEIEVYMKLDKRGKYAHHDHESTYKGNFISHIGTFVYTIIAIFTQMNTIRLTNRTVSGALV